MYTHTTNKGSVLIITIVITAVLLSIGTTLASILDKEVTRQIYSRRSQQAMNIANSALECVLFNDFYRSIFQSLTETEYTEVDCGDLYQVRKSDEDNNWAVYIPDPEPLENDEQVIVGAGTYTFVVVQTAEKDLSGVSEVPCAHITIKKVCAVDDTTVITDSEGVNHIICGDGLIETSVEVKGYNACSSGETERERRLVRRFKVHY